MVHVEWGVKDVCFMYICSLKLSNLPPCTNWMGNTNFNHCCNTRVRFPGSQTPVWMFNKHEWMNEFNDSERLDLTSTEYWLTIILLTDKWAEVASSLYQHTAGLASGLSLTNIQHQQAAQEKISVIHREEWQAGDAISEKWLNVPQHNNRNTSKMDFHNRNIWSGWQPHQPCPWGTKTL